MNNTTKAKYDMATRMLKGHIDVDEVALMTGLPVDELTALKEKVAPKNKDAEILEKYDNVDLDIGTLLFDDLPAEDEELEGFHVGPKDGEE